MANMNYYKIDDSKEDSFIEALEMKWDIAGNTSVEVNSSEYYLTLYLPRPLTDIDKDVSWAWILKLFKVETIKCPPAPRAIVVIDLDDKGMYACTFGCSYYAVDKYCDMDWGFKFGRRLKYKNIKTSTIANPNAKRNKSVNTYIDEKELVFTSGESYKKLKAACVLEEGFDLFNETVEIGNSIKLSSEDVTLERMVQILLRINDDIESKPEIHKIPVFMKVKDQDRIELLENRLLERLLSGEYSFNLSELEIIGVYEIFNRAERIELRDGHNKKDVDILSDDVLKQFCDDYGIEYPCKALDVKVRFTDGDGNFCGQKTIKELIDYTDDEQQCILSQGDWFYYNDDYLDYLDDTVYGIDTEYNQKFDFSPEMRDQLIKRKMVEEKLSKSKASDRYYREFAFNTWMHEKYGFELKDRDSVMIKGQRVEIQDLYKDGESISVKFGTASSVLAYVVDQSLNAFDLIRRKIGTEENVDTVAILINLMEHNHLDSKEDGSPDLRSLKMLVLKNRLVDWVFKVQMYGKKVKVYVNYYR